MTTFPQMQNAAGFSATPGFLSNFKAPSTLPGASGYGLGQLHFASPQTNYIYNSEAPQPDIWGNYQPVSPAVPVYQHFPGYPMQQTNQSTFGNATSAAPTSQEFPTPLDDLLDSTPESEMY